MTIETLEKSRKISHFMREHYQLIHNYPETYQKILTKGDDFKQVVRTEIEIKAILMGEVLQHSSFGCQHANVTELFEILLGSKIDGERATSRRPKTFGEFYNLPYLVVVPTKNENSHDYPINKPCMLLDYNYALRMFGGRGNHLPVGSSISQIGPTAPVRVATELEVDQFFDNFVDKVTTFREPRRTGEEIIGFLDWFEATNLEA